MEGALKTVSTFSDFAGPRLNLQKTEGLLLGPLKHSSIKSCNNIEFKDSPIKCLGIYIGHDKKKCEELNWDSKIHKMENILKLWGKRNLTIFGKVTIVNTLCLPKVMYNCMLLVVPERVVVKIEKMISHFIWRGKNRINRNCVINSVENGGLNLVDVRLKIKSLKAGWINRWMKNPLWALIAESFLKAIGVNFNLLLRMDIKNINDLPVMKSMPPFNQDVWMSYFSCKTYKPITKMTDYDFLTSSIWGNNIFKLNNQCLFSKNLISSNIIFVKDLFDGNGKFIHEEVFINIIDDKRNWMVEYLTLKKVIMNKAKKFNTSHSKFIKNCNLRKRILFFDGKNLVDLENEKSKMFYKILIRKNSTRHYMEKVWETKFNQTYNSSKWSNIYSRMVKSVPCKKLSEFRYKLLHNLIYPMYILNKWKPSVSSHCSFCHETETLEHLLFKCERINDVWNKVGQVIRVNIKWKHLVIGLDERYSEIMNKAKNMIITIVVYSIFAGWVKCGESKESFKYINIWNNALSKLNLYLKIFSEFVHKLLWYSKFNKLIEELRNM